MICEINENDNYVVLHNITFQDVVTFAMVWLTGNKQQIIFANTNDTESEEDK